MWDRKTEDAAKLLRNRLKAADELLGFVKELVQGEGFNPSHHATMSAARRDAGRQLIERAERAGIQVRS